jgi:uncharacterized membrane protein SpoIIM required for sporulation
MKETRFIAQNKEKWQESENLVRSEIKDPDKLSNLFTQVIDDLSYSRTYYPNRSVRVYLNKIARQYFSIIYGHRSDRKSGFSDFWTEEVPQIVIHCRKELLISLLFFLAAMAIGVFSSVKDTHFANSILGDSYVTMSNENIEKGDPMAVYKKANEVEMFLGITINNLLVAFRTYVLGIFLAIGTLAMLLYNGIMVGCFQYFFVERGLFWQSALTIWLHGTLEISSIVLAGGAGLTLGRGLVFPGTLSRLQAFQISAIRSLKLMMGITPLFVIAAIIESFVTRYTAMPDSIKLFFILMSATFIIGYFVIYPWWKSKKGFREPLKEVRLTPSSTEPLNFFKLKNNAEILKDTFHFYTRNANAFLSWILLISLVQSGIIQYLRHTDTNVVYINDGWLQELIANMFFATKTDTPIFILINCLCTSLILYRVMELLDNEFKKTSFKLNVKSFVQLSVMVALMYGLLYLGTAGIIILVALIGILLLISFTQLTTRSNLGSGVARGWSLGLSTRQLIEFQAMMLILSFSFLVVLSAPLVLMYSSILQWNFALSDTWGQTVIKVLETFIKVFSFNLIIPILAVATGFLYFTLQEVNTARHLKEAISRLGTRSPKHQAK